MRSGGSWFKKFILSWLLVFILFSNENEEEWEERGIRKGQLKWKRGKAIHYKRLFGHNFAQWLYDTCQKSSALCKPYNNKVHSDAKQ